MTLSELIKKVGAEKIAEIAQVSLPTVYSWRDLKSTPKAINGHLLIEHFGFITWGDLMDEFITKLTGPEDINLSEEFVTVKLKKN